MIDFDAQYRMEIALAAMAKDGNSRRLEVVTECSAALRAFADAIDAGSGVRAVGDGRSRCELRETLRASGVRIRELMAENERQKVLLEQLRPIVESVTCGRL